MEYVVFAIDNNTDNHTVAKFMRLMDTKRALGDMTGNMVQCIGNWEGILEVSYIVTTTDYVAHVIPSGYAKGQMAVMVVPASTRQPATIWDADLGKMQVVLGPVKEITAQDAKPDVAWTFNTTTGKYFTADTAMRKVMNELC